jgi:hypothetical protein
MYSLIRSVGGLALIALFFACTPVQPPLPEGVKPCTLDDPPLPVTLPLPPGSAFFIPQAPVYPYQDRGTVTETARCISGALESYVKAWLDGRATAAIPEVFLPKGYNTKDYSDIHLVPPEDIKPEQQWAIRQAEPINLNALRGSFPDPNVTYIVIPHLYAPFGSTLVIEGQFPHSRFFDIQVTPSFDADNYHYDANTGVGEVPIVDADIGPLPGSVNPFRVGADRNATNRNYRMTYDLEIGDPVALNQAFRPPYFRDSSQQNRRVGGALMYQGPWGKAGGHGRGLWDFGQVWIRYYAPDASQGAFGGVPLPKAYYQLPDGRKFFIAADLTSFIKRSNQRVAAPVNAPVEPNAAKLEGADMGWFKQTGIFKAVVAGIAISTQWAGKQYVRDLDRGVTSRSEDLPAPHNYEQSATSATYVDYLVRGMSLGAGKVVVLTGKLPTFPQTRNGESTFSAAQMRYWSLTGYIVPSDESFLSALDPNNPIGLAIHAVRDDEITLDANRRYVIALSRPEDRPANANASSGVTWVNWGPNARVSWTLRWMSIGPEWTFPLTPNPQLVGFGSDWASANYNKALTGNNDSSGVMGEYQPQIHYLTKAQFEAQGTPVQATAVPVWK